MLSRNSFLKFVSHYPARRLTTDHHQALVAERSKALQLSCRGLAGAWVRIPLETYIFILNFSLPPRSEQVNRAVANEIKHVHSPEVIVVLDPRYDLSYKALYISTCSIALSTVLEILSGPCALDVCMLLRSFSTPSGLIISGGMLLLARLVVSGVDKRRVLRKNRLELFHKYLGLVFRVYLQDFFATARKGSNSCVILSPRFDITPKGLSVIFLKSHLYRIVNILDFRRLECFFELFLKMSICIPLARLFGTRMLAFLLPHHTFQSRI